MANRKKTKIPVATPMRALVINQQLAAKALAVALIGLDTSFQYVAREASGVFYLRPNDWKLALQQVPDRTITSFTP